MGLLDSILGAVSGSASATSPESNPLMAVLGSVLSQNGGLQGLAQKFGQAGQGSTFGSWVGTGQNQPISGSQIQQVLGSQQVQQLAAKLGIDPQQAAHFISQYLPMVIDKLTPQGQIDPNANHQQALAQMLPQLMKAMGGGGTSTPV